MKEYRIKSQTAGFALFTVILVFAVVFTLGSAILFASTSEHRFTAIDSYRQSAYYIAESGVYLLESEIKEWIEEDENKSEEEFLDFFQEKDYTDKFDKGSTRQEISLNVTLVPLVKEEGASVDTQLYQIISTGSVNGFERVVYQDFEIRIEEDFYERIEDLSLSANSYVFKNETVKARGNAVLGSLHSDMIRDDSHIDITRIYFKEKVHILRGSIKLGPVEGGEIYAANNVVFENGDHQIYSEMHVKGNLELSGVTLHQNVFVVGNLTIGEGVNFSNPDIRIHYGGELSIGSETHYAKERFIEMEKFKKWKIPYQNVTLKDEVWYNHHQFNVDSSPVYQLAVDTVNGSNLYVVKYDHSTWIEKTQKPVVIISQGDIKIHVGSNFYGALIAPYGSIEITDGSLFKGVIIARDGVDVKKDTQLDLIRPSEMWDDLKKIPFDLSTVYENNDLN